jgi:hypothetical protein
MLEGVDLDQHASVLWWSDGDTPTKGFKWGGTRRQFQTLRAALNFVLNILTETERGTALVNFDSPPFALDFNAPETARQAHARVTRRPPCQAGLPSLLSFRSTPSGSASPARAVRAQARSSLPSQPCGQARKRPIEAVHSGRGETHSQQHRQAAFAARRRTQMTKPDKLMRHAIMLELNQEHAGQPSQRPSRLAARAVPGDLAGRGVEVGRRVPPFPPFNFLGKFWGIL